MKVRDRLRRSTCKPSVVLFGKKEQGNPFGQSDIAIYAEAAQKCHIAYKPRRIPSFWVQQRVPLYGHCVEPQHASVRLCKVPSIYEQRLGWRRPPTFHILHTLQRPQTFGFGVWTALVCAGVWHHLAIWDLLLPSAPLDVLPSVPCSKQTQVSFVRMSTCSACYTVLHEPFGVCSSNPFPFVDYCHGKAHLFWQADLPAGFHSNLQPEILAAEPSVGLLGGL